MGVSGAACSCVGHGQRRLNVFNWENYVASTTIPDFEKEFGVQVRYATYGSAEEMLAKVTSGNSGWDVVFPSNSFIVPMRELGLLLQLDHSRLRDLGNLAPRFESPAWDPKLEWSVPYMHSATGIVYSRSVAKPPLRWSDLWQDRYQHRMTMLDDSAEVFGACLKQMGKSINASDPQDLRRARDLAIGQKPLVRAYLNEEVRDQVVAGDVLAAQMWAQVAQVALDSSSELAFSFPEEGFPLYADNVCILRESEHRDVAYEFLNYLLRPKVAATICSEMRSATANGAAQRLLSRKDRESMLLYPPDEVLGRGEWFRDLPVAAQRLRDRYWTEVKSA